jgi:exonuclease III
LAQEERRQDEVLTEEALSLSWLYIWEGSVIQHNGVMILIKEEVAPEREKGGDNVSWAVANLTKPEK